MVTRLAVKVRIPLHPVLRLIPALHTRARG
jgi:hypothetical protein